MSMMRKSLQKMSIFYLLTQAFKLTISAVFVTLVLLLLIMATETTADSQTQFTPARNIWHVPFFVIATLTLWLSISQIRPVSYWPFVIFSLSIIIVLPTLFTIAAFGVRGLDQMTLYLAFGNVAEVAGLVSTVYFLDSLAFVFSVAICMSAAFYLYRRVKYFSVILLALSPFLFYFSPVMELLKLQLRVYFADVQMNPQEVVAGVEITKEPDEPKNLVLIYLESMEETFAELPSTRAGFAPLIDKANTGIRFRGLAQYPGTGYTVGGLTATQCGVPLLLPDGRFFFPGKNDSAYDYGNFMPAMTCLGDILADRGYDTKFIIGGDLDSFGIRNLLETHGYNFLYDRRDFHREGLALRTNEWGVDDDIFYKKVEDELARSAALDKPFLMGIENIGTHSPDGFLDKSCGKEPEGIKLPLAVECSVRHVLILLDTIDKLGLSDSTIVAVMSDHLIMRNSLKSEFAAFQGPRHNLAFILNAGSPMEIQRDASMMDIFPTLLDVMGFGIKDGKAGLGRSLLSDTQTLPEEMGMSDFNVALSLNPELAKYLWRAENDEVAR